MTSNSKDIDDVKAEIQRIKQELDSAQQAGDLAQVDFQRKRLLQLRISSPVCVSNRQSCCDQVSKACLLKI